jgi:hypothetical protein
MRQVRDGEGDSEIMPRGGKRIWTEPVYFLVNRPMLKWLKKQAKQKGKENPASIIRLLIIDAMEKEEVS